MEKDEAEEEEITSAWLVEEVPAEALPQISIRLSPDPTAGL